MNKGRRQFFQKSLTLAGALVAAPALLNTLQAHAEEGRRGGGAAAAPTLVDPNDPMAKSLGFVLDHNKSPDSKGNKCATCSLFTAGAKKDGKNAGACQLFKDKIVYADSFCKSWSAKAKKA